ncbi:MAG: NAD(P)-binding protein, partial [Oscillospiraceae bacterium]|nr:NAD(P)-binding protein [Oscillospiraceae bacterium]
MDHRYHFYTHTPYYNEYCHNVKYTEAIKREIDIPVSVVGSIKTLKDAQEIISSGKADMVSMCRQLMADPDTIKKSKSGQEDTIRPCLRCLQVCNKNVDEGRPVRCAVNPVVGREGKFSDIRPARIKKKVVVVGGGAAGMMAAQTLTDRGHTVVLFEEKDHLGGHLPDICKLPFKDDLKQYTEWNVRTTLQCGADVRLNTRATPELIAAEDPDALMIATGSRLTKPRIPGIDGENVTDVIEV